MRLLSWRPRFVVTRSQGYDYRATGTSTRNGATIIDIQEVCGLKGIEKRAAKVEWHEAKLRILGAERYELGTKNIEVRFLNHGPGILITTKTKVSIEAEELLGKKYFKGRIHDVEVVTGFITLSLSKIAEDKFPRTITAGETVEFF
jgi:hypothetical protein